MSRVSKLKLYLVALIAGYIGYQLTPLIYRHPRYIEMERNHKSNNFQRDTAMIMTTSPKTIASMSVNVTNEQNVYDMIEAWFKTRSSVDSLLNKHEFVFQKDSNVCEDHPDVLIFVHSAARNTNKRGLIRKTWGSIKRVKNVTVATVFMLGQTKHAYLQARVSNESETYGDIVQGNFLDSYRNMTYKHIMALYWAVLNCPDVNIFIKVDDDVLVNVFKLTSVNTVAYIRCVVYAKYKPFRGMARLYKWNVTPEEYPYSKYHDFCSGMAYIISSNEIKQLLEMSKSTRYFWIDDIYVTGVLRRMAGIRIRHFSRMHRLSLSPGTDSAMFYMGVMKNWTTIWTNILTRYSDEQS